MKKYRIVEEETVQNTFEVEIPDDIAEQGEDAIFDYWYSLEPGMYLIDSECRDLEIVEATDITNVERIH